MFGGKVTLNQFGYDAFSGNQVHHSDVGHIHHPLRDSVAEGRNPVYHDEGVADQSRLYSRGPAGYYTGPGVLQDSAGILHQRDAGSLRFGRDPLGQQRADVVALRRGERGRERQQKLGVGLEQGRGPDHFRQVEPYFLAAAAWQEADPRFGRIETRLASKIFAGNRRGEQLRQGMADEFGVHSAVVVEALLEREDDQHAVHIALDAADTVFLPGPKLGTDEINHRHSLAAQMLRQREIDVGKVDQDGGGGLFFSDRGAEAAVFAIDVREVTQDFGDAHDGHVFRADDGAKAEGFHAFSAEA